MHIKKPPTEPSGLDDAIESAILRLNNYPPHTDEYAKTVAQLERLYSFKTAKSSRRVTPDTLAIVLGNLAGIVIIVGHERAHLVTSKALTFIQKAAR